MDGVKLNQTSVEFPFTAGADLHSSLQIVNTATKSRAIRITPGRSKEYAVERGCTILLPPNAYVEKGVTCPAFPRKPFWFPSDSFTFDAFATIEEMDDAAPTAAGTLGRLQLPVTFPEAPPPPPPPAPPLAPLPPLPPPGPLTLARSASAGSPVESNAVRAALEATGHDEVESLAKKLAERNEMLYAARERAAQLAEDVKVREDAIKAMAVSHVESQVNSQVEASGNSLFPGSPPRGAAAAAEVTAAAAVVAEAAEDREKVKQRLEKAEERAEQAVRESKRLTAEIARLMAESRSNRQRLDELEMERSSHRREKAAWEGREAEWREEKGRWREERARWEGERAAMQRQMRALRAEKVELEGKFGQLHGNQQGGLSENSDLSTVTDDCDSSDADSALSSAHATSAESGVRSVDQSGELTESTGSNEVKEQSRGRVGEKPQKKEHGQGEGEEQQEEQEQGRDGETGEVRKSVAGVRWDMLRLAARHKQAMREVEEELKEKDEKIRDLGMAI
ncbi:unnamed protein product, partial [Closterium sp. NIES-64]